MVKLSFQHSGLQNSDFKPKGRVLFGISWNRSQKFKNKKALERTRGREEEFLTKKNQDRREEVQVPVHPERLYDMEDFAHA
jgi:hypothetical protein